MTKRCIIFDFDCTLTKTHFYYFTSEFNTYKRMYLDDENINGKKFFFANNQLVNMSMNDIINLQQYISTNIWKIKRTEVNNFILNEEQKKLFINIIFGGSKRIEILKKYFDFFKNNNIDIHISTRGYYAHVNWCLKIIGLDGYIKDINSMSGTRIFEDDKFVFYKSRDLAGDSEEQIIYNGKMYNLLLKNISDDARYYKHDYFKDHILHKYNLAVYVDDSELYYNLLTLKRDLIKEKDKSKIRIDVEYFGEMVNNEYNSYSKITYDNGRKFIFVSLPEDYGGGLNLNDNEIYSDDNYIINIETICDFFKNDHNINQIDHKGGYYHKYIKYKNKYIKYKNKYLNKKK